MPSLTAAVRFLSDDDTQPSHSVGLSSDLFRALDLHCDRDPVVAITICDESDDAYIAQAYERNDGVSTCTFYPSFWKRNAPAIEPEDDQVLNIRVEKCNTAQLDEVVIGLPSDDDISEGTRSFLESLITSRTVLRTGFSYPFRNDRDRFVVLSTTPVLQGTATQNTNLIVTKTLHSAPEEENSNVREPQYSHFDLIGDDFLAGTILEGRFADGLHFPISADEGEEEKEDREDREEEEKVNGHQQLPTASRPEPTEIAKISSCDLGVRLAVSPLTAPYPSRKLVPRPPKEDDPESHILVSLWELARIKAFSGDWVLVCGSDESKSRSCRIYGVSDSFFSESSTQAFVSPLLLHNLGHRPNQPLPFHIRVRTIRNQAPPPVAKSVTVARVASPLTILKSMQASMVEGLRECFENGKRVLNVGDIVPVAVDEDDSRLRPRKKDDFDTYAPIQFPSHIHSRKTLLYFQITKLDDGNPDSSMTFSPISTSLLQSSVTHSPAPASLHQYLSRSPPPPSFADDELYRLMRSMLYPRANLLGLRCTVFLKGGRGVGKKTKVLDIAQVLGLHVVEVNLFDLVGESDAKTESAFRAQFDTAVTCAPCVLLLRHLEGIATKSQLAETGKASAFAGVLSDCLKQVDDAQRIMGWPIAVVGTTSEEEKIPGEILARFRHEVRIESPDQKARFDILSNLLSRSPLSTDVSLNHIASHTAALVAKDLVDLVARAGAVAMERVLGTGNAVHSERRLSDRELLHAGVVLMASDFEKALEKSRASYSDSIGAPKIPNVTWDDVGGLASVKSDILDTIQLPLDHPELFASGLKKRSGILLYGPPGTGKTLLAKAVATSCSLNFFSVKGPELLNMYIGESEANVRRVFQKARDARPCVVFFDELDSVAPKRGEQGDSGGVMDRIVSQLLAELDGMTCSSPSSSGDVFVIGATNRPDLLDSALLRPGRFDKLLYLGVPQDHASQLKILQALTRKFQLDPELELSEIAELCPFHYTGADFYALCSDAMLNSMTRVARSVETKIVKHNTRNSPPITVSHFLETSDPSEVLVQVTELDFRNALEKLVPSVSKEEVLQARLSGFFLAVKRSMTGEIFHITWKGQTRHGGGSWSNLPKGKYIGFFFEDKTEWNEKKEERSAALL